MISENTESVYVLLVQSKFDEASSMLNYELAKIHWPLECWQIVDSFDMQDIKTAASI